MQNAHMNVLLPDALLMLAVVVAWLNDTFNESAGTRKLTAAIALISTVVAAIWYGVLATDPNTYYFFSNMYVVDPFANLMKAFVSVAYAVSVIYSRQYLEARDLFRADYYLLGMFS